jgi:hypothetical protein
MGCLIANIECRDKFNGVILFEVISLGKMNGLKFN